MTTHSGSAPVPEKITTAVERRIAQSTRRRTAAIEDIEQGRPLDAEHDESRKVRRLEHVTGLDELQAEALSKYEISPRDMGLSGDPQRGAERILGISADFVGVAFLDLARTSARTVGRVARSDRSPWATGFLVSKNLFLTNNHVIASPAQARELVVEFDYELDAQRNRRPITSFRFAPDDVFLTSPEDDLDFTLIAIGDRLDGQRSLAELGYCLLSDSPDRHTLGEYVNIVQHPDGRYKEVVLRENRLVWRSDNVLHYIADTEPGSSGSPVFNDQWEPVALHHWGGPHRDLVDAQGHRLNQEINEGLRISSIVKIIRSGAGLQGNKRQLVAEAVVLWDSKRPPNGKPHEIRPPDDGSEGPPQGPQIGADGRATWTIPLTVTVGLGCLTSQAVVGTTPALSAAVDQPTPPRRDNDKQPEAVQIDENYDNRKGYDPEFLHDFRVDLPTWGERHHPAPRIDSPPAAKKYVLDYEHFSLVLNSKRRMANFTAVNIDGKKSKRVDRVSGRVAETAEAAERWYRDRRVAEGHQSDQSLYSNQQPVRLFDRGHLVRREDPNWGSDSAAERANADTFHFANCTPQAKDFNQKAKYWQGIENYILNNARAEKQRVVVFTGPVFADDDPEYRYARVPRQFWKILVRVENDELLVTALLADQSGMLASLPERSGRIAEDLVAESLPEKFDDLGNVAEYQTTVAEIESLTGLDFGELRDHDTAAEGGEALHVRNRLESFEDLRLKPPKEAFKKRRRESKRDD